MRTLKKSFIQSFVDTKGKYRRILQLVQKDPELDLQIRNNYINIYYKGHSLIKLEESGKYEINTKFRKGIKSLPPVLASTSDSQLFVDTIPFLKQNVLHVKYSKQDYEIEFEQDIIRANNNISSVNSEIYITDRQYTDDEYDARFDLSGVYWPTKGRSQKKEVKLCFLELKYSLNPDIGDIDQQLLKYYNAVNSKLKNIIQETKELLKIKAELGLFNISKAQKEAFKQFRFSENIKDVLILIGLIDYNPNSTKFDSSKLSQLPFKDQIRIFHTGFAIWDKKLESIS
jgi:hypothetical protein